MSTLNKFLIFYFNLTNKRNLSMSSNFLSPSSVVQKKSTVNVDKGLDQIVRYLSKTFKVQKMLLFNWLKLIVFFQVELRISQNQKCISCGKRLSKASPAGPCNDCTAQSNQSTISVSNGFHSKSLQQDSSSAVKLILIPPYCPEIEALRKSFPSRSKQILSPRIRPVAQGFKKVTATDFDVPKPKVKYFFF